MLYLLSQAIDQSAQRVPEAEAFRFEEQSITYADLVRKANGLARVLQQHGVQKGDRVGLYLSKSLESAIALYGIWKAGAAYVPLDPLAPISRLAFIVQNCEIRCLITQPNKRSRLRELLQVSTGLNCIIGIAEAELEIESDRPDLIPWELVWQEADDRAPDVRVMEQDLAYVMYTSGSTGDPKGIMHTHKSGLSYAQMAVQTYGLHEGDRLGNHSPLHFDMSTLDYFAGPLAGATTVIISEAHTKMPASLSQLIEAEALTIWYSVPFALIQLLLRGVLEQRNFRSLRWILFGGEPFPVKYLSELMHRLPEARFGNVYGPAEVNQCTYYHLPPLAPGDVLPEDGVPIGAIWPNAEAFVADDRYQPVSQGEIGELLVRSPTMMQGYWRQAELSDRAFVRKTVPGDVEATYFCTGDLVKQRSDGLYQFVGRKDRQVKARGYRVELDEVEAVLVAHEEVEEAAVFAVPLAVGSRQIEAAIILTANSKLTAIELNRYAAARLPNYAVPVQLAIAETFPRTTSGKIDRRALQAQAQARIQATTLGAPNLRESSASGIHTTK